MAHMGKVSHIGNKGKSVTCLNCGEMCRGNYCSHCGQATSTSRLQTRSFMLDTLSGLLRVNRGFFFTAWNLLIHPWAVIRDYAAGRRVRYLAPVAMLLVLCLISVVADSLVPSSDSLSMMLDDRMDRASKGGVYWFYAALKYIWTSPVLQNLLFFIPGVILVPVIFRKYGGGRYNAAEYLMAAIYIWWMLSWRLTLSSSRCPCCLWVAWRRGRAGSMRFLSPSYPCRGLSVPVVAGGCLP